MYRFLDDVSVDLSFPVDVKIVTFENDVILVKGCVLNKFNTNPTCIKNPKVEDMINCNVLTIKNMPCVASSCIPVSVFMVQDNIYPFLPVNDLRVNNICGRIIMRKSFSCAEVFRPKYSNCIIVTQNKVLGTQKCISHLYGNMCHAEKTNFIHFRAFKSHKDFRKITSRILNPDVLEDCHVSVSMFCAICNIGLHVGVNDFSMLQWQMTSKYGDRVYFFPRTDEQNNIMFFKFKNLNDVFPQYSPKNMVTCSMTRRGIMNIKITWNDSKSSWDEDLHNELISIAKNIRLIVQLLV